MTMRRAKKFAHKGLLTVALAGAIVLLVGAVFQQKPLPTEKDLDAALKKLATDANDLDANTTVGRYYAFVQDEWDKAVPFILHGKDKGMIAMIAEEQKDDGNKFTAAEIGDKWLKAGDSAGAMKPYYRDRAVVWYGRGWEAGLNQDPVWGDKLRARLELIQTVAAGGKGSRVGKIPSWNLQVAEVGSKYARRGTQSVKIVKDAYLTSDITPAKIGGKDFILTAYVLTDKNNSTDPMFIKAFDQNGASVYEKFMDTLPDQPYWHRIQWKDKFPVTASRFQVGFHSRSNNTGAMWVDTASLNVDGVEQLKNPSFEP